MITQEDIDAFRENEPAHARKVITKAGKNLAYEFNAENFALLCMIVANFGNIHNFQTVIDIAKEVAQYYDEEHNR